VKKSKFKERIGKQIGVGLIIIVAVLWILPVLWMVSTSFKPESMVMQAVPRWIPEVFTLDNYRGVLQRADLFRWIFNSVTVAVFTTGAVLLIDSMAGYAFARLKFPGRDILFLTVVATMMVPAQVTMIPLFFVLNEMSLLNTHLALALPRLGVAIGVFMLRQFFLALPMDLEEAALIDGCSRYRIFFQIILPLAKPSLSALGILTFVWTWNDFMWPLIAISSNEMYTLPIGLSTLVGYYGREYGIQMAGAFIATLPVLLVFMLFQKQFIKGIAFSGLKG
jgi:multiple sugar transport system permease protein